MVPAVPGEEAHTVQLLEEQLRIYRERLICDERIRLFSMEERARADARIRSFADRERRRLTAIVASDFGSLSSPEPFDEDGRELERR